eukprot:3656527-Pyramimonas_sp.AAC.1
MFEGKTGEELVFARLRILVLASAEGASRQRLRGRREPPRPVLLRPVRPRLRVRPGSSLGSAGVARGGGTQRSRDA